LFGGGPGALNLCGECGLLFVDLFGARVVLLTRSPLREVLVQLGVFFDARLEVGHDGRVRIYLGVGARFRGAGLLRRLGRRVGSGCPTLCGVRTTGGGDGE
jgi:hypothetical protein